MKLEYGLGGLWQEMDRAHSTRSETQTSTRKNCRQQQIAAQVRTSLDFTLSDLSDKKHSWCWCLQQWQRNQLQRQRSPSNRQVLPAAARQDWSLTDGKTSSSFPPSGTCERTCCRRPEPSSRRERAVSMSERTAADSCSPQAQLDIQTTKTIHHVRNEKQ